ncbi:hypothetical protein F511_40216 [Dorcoceras hygrometricum]|uniref:Uncharacterized protein n=1 Tax=Dorcoceras hygrometricum TaxID=472368 RepID=A0A2Z7C1Z7_9LAMI|nr:hypothetical protein F511_40216 [Dorcoceras hygrometricum]
MDEVPKDLIYDAWSALSASGEPIKTSCKKKEMKIEFRLLNDILAKTVKNKASFDAVTHERFLLMAAIHGGIKINWSKFLFTILKDMGAPDLTLEESKAFPHLKILTVKTVGTYVAKKKSLPTDSEEVKEKEVVEKVVKAAVKRRPAPTAEPVSKKQRTTVGRAAPTEKILAIVPVVQEVVSITVVPAESPSAQRCQEPKRKLILQEDEEATDEQEKEKRQLRWRERDGDS